MYVDIVALVSLVPTIATVLRENFVVMMTNAQQLVLGNPVPFIPSVVLVNLVVMLMTNVQQLVLGNRVSLITTVLLVSLVVMMMTNVQ